ncbi:MAG: TrkH family potassium uptake protein [Clostridia bacterium]|nr:TrkH family potassium uptake protein [Clostridia bacterium]
MNYRAIRFFLGHILRIEALFMLPALLLSLLKSEWSAVRGFAVAIILLAAISLLLHIKTSRDRRIFAREGFIIVALSWILLSFFGALPFYISREIPSLLDAWFETVSGFTTTGATILKDVEALSMGLLYWRSFTHWLGGMGVLVFLLAVLPLSGGGSTLHLLKAESPGPDTGKLTPKLKQSVGILYLIYVALTVLQTLLLLAGGMPLFDAVTTAFGTAGTGGFSVLNSSMASYSHYCQTVVAIFMMLFGVNFSIYYLVLLGQLKRVWKNEELRTYLCLILAATLIVTLNTLKSFPSFFDALHHGYFQVVSIMTTTGFATVDFNLWPELSRMLLLVLMVIGACAGSTGGGFKISRLLVLFKSFRYGMKKLIHPNAVKVITLDGKRIDRENLASVHWFSMAYFLSVCASLLIVSLDNHSMDTSISGVLACVNNIGPGLDVIGPVGNYSVFSPLSKLVLSFDMLLGRLEFFPVLLLFSPAVWRKHAK